MLVDALVCSECGSAACAGTQAQHCRHTGKIRQRVEPGRSMLNTRILPPKIPERYGRLGRPKQVVIK